MTLKVPPPPQLPKEQQPLNRWLIELQSILNSDGFINPSSVVDLPATYVQVAANKTNITVLQGQVTTLDDEVATNTVNIATNTANIAANTAGIATLQARNQVYNGSGAPAVGLGSVGDWYADTSGSHIYVKTAIATWTFII